MNNKDLYSDKLISGKRTYFFDINKSDQGDLYLKISESKKVENSFEHHQLIVFEENIKRFSEVFQKILLKLKEFKEPNQKDNKTYSVEKIRETFKQAYLPWTEEDDNKLELFFCEGKKVSELAQIFERNDGAISSRIKKLELKEKYGRE